jgi:hypothetical protein
MGNRTNVTCPLRSNTCPRGPHHSRGGGFRRSDFPVRSPSGGPPRHGTAQPGRGPSMPLAWWGQSGRPPPVRRLPPRRTRHRAYRERHPDTDKDTAHKPDQHLTGRQFQRRGGPVPRLRVTAGGAPAAGGEGCRSPADEAVEHGPARVQQARTGPARRPLLPYRPGTAPDRHAAGAGDQLPQHHLPEGLRRELLQGEGADEDVDDDASGESSAPCDGRRLFPLGLSRRAAPATGGTRAPEAPLVRRRRRQMPFLETPDGPMCGRTVRVPPYRAVRSGTSMPGGRHVPVVATGRGRRSWRWACGVRLIRVVGGYGRPTRSWRPAQ